VKLGAANWAFAAFFVILAAAIIAIGIHDASLSGVGFGVTAGGVLLIALGAVLCAAAYQLVRFALGSTSYDRGRSVSAIFVPLAFFLTMLIGVYVFFAGIRAANEQQSAVIVVSLSLIVVALLGLRSFPIDLKGRPRVGAAVAVALFGTLIGTWEFWYQNQYVPSRAWHAVAINVALRRQTPSRRYEVVKASLGYQDIGSKSVSVLGSVYTLTGSRVVSCNQHATPRGVGKFFMGLLGDPQRTRYMADVWEELPPTVLATGKLIGDGKRLDPGVSSSRDLIFQVPRHEYQLLRFRAQVFAIPASVPISQRVRPTFLQFDGDNEVYGLWHIDDNSWFHDLVNGRERWVAFRYEIVNPAKTRSTITAPDMRVTARFPKSTWSNELPSKAEVQSLFSKENSPREKNEAFAGTEMALEPVSKPDLEERSRLPCK
jgi:hypothetical protein